MLFIVFLLILGSGYVFWKFKTAVNKNLFIKSPFFRSAFGSISILAFSIIIINVFRPGLNEVDEKTQVKVETNRPIDYSDFVNSIQGKDLAFHYQFIQKIPESDVITLDSLNKYYNTISNYNDSASIAVGRFGIGMISFRSKDYQKAIASFNRITKSKISFVHFCLGQAYFRLGDKGNAETHYLKELSIENGNVDEAFLALTELYISDRDFVKLKKLFLETPNKEMIPSDLAALTFLQQHEFFEYLKWLTKLILSRIKLWGLFAALIISLVWIFYLSKLSVFRKIKPAPIVFLFIGGGVSTILPIVLAQLNELHLEWNATGAFWKDALYYVVMVGLPEETAKFIPLVIFVSLDRKNNEPLKFIIYASISALGFAFVENLIYFQKTSYGIIHGRAYITVIGHMFFSCLAAYAIVLYQFKYKMNNRIYFILMILIALIVSSILHGLFDLFLYQNQNFAFYILFIFSVQVWIIIINNSLNNASTFSYSKVTRLEYLQVFIAIALTLIFSLEYFLTSLTRGYEEANYQFSSNFWFAGFAIGFFSSNLSSFNLVRNYWRDIYFSSRERRGYGTMTRGSVLTNWYFVNSIRAHNYVGLKLLLSNDQHNRLLKEVIRTPFEAEIIDRLILCENGDQDPHWFLLKLSQPITIDNYTSKCVLVKLRYQEESLLQNENVQVFFRFVVDEEALNSNILQKEIFPPYGWARLNSFS